MDIVGSFRRQAATSGDIDVLLRVPKDTDKKEAKQHLEEYVHALKQHEYIEEVLALGEHKCMAISRIPGGKARRLDLLMTPNEEYAYAILYFTGSDKFNVAFRQHALQKGYTLNEHTLKPIREGVRDVPYMKTEREIQLEKNPFTLHSVLEKQIMNKLHFGVPLVVIKHILSWIM
jgi:DNA polymerase/3'-5' exonuclease PolX